MSKPVPTVPKQKPAHLFKPGQSGNPAGRPKGSRNRLADQFITDLAETWSTHGVAALEACATKEPGTFLKVIASLMPKDVNISGSISVDVDAKNFVERFRAARALLGNEAAEPIKTIKAKVIEHVS